MLLTVSVLSGCGSKSVPVAEAAAGASASQTEVQVAIEEQIAEKKPEATKEQDEEVSFTDALGREVKVSSPKRVVTLLGSFCDEWLLAGGSVVGTASDTFSNYDFDLEGVADTGSNLDPDVETILSLDPDFVIASSKLDGQIGLLETFEKSGINVAYIDVDNFDDYLSTLDIFTRITGDKSSYEEYGTKVSEEIAKAKERIDGTSPTVLFIRAAASSVKVKGSKGTVGGEILSDLGTVNIADSDSKLEDLSMEAVIAADPDYIFVTVQGSDIDGAMANVDELLISNPAWSSLKAVKNDHYYVLDKMLYNSKPNARWGEAYQKLADILYPEE